MPSYIVRDPNTGKRYKVRRGVAAPSPDSGQTVVAEPAAPPEGFNLAKGIRQYGTGLSGGYTGGLTDILANKAGIPQSPMRNVGGVVGMLAGGLPAQAAKLGRRAVVGMAPRAVESVLGRMAIRGAEGALGAGATQLGQSVEEGNVFPMLRAAGMGGAIGVAVPPIGAVAKGVPYTKLFGGGKRFAETLEKSPARVDLTQEAETLARARSGVNPALRRQTLSKAEQTHQNLTGTTPVENLLNARGQVGVSEAHDVANLTSQNLAKSYFEKLGEALRGGNELQQLGLKSSINRKIVAADPALKELYKNYSTGQAINQFVSNLNPLGIPLRILRAMKSVR